MTQDVCYHMNDCGVPTINCAVEESTLADRDDALLPQDQFIHDNLGPNDILIVSVGGNDIALRPSLRTMWNMLKLMYLNSYKGLRTPHAFGMPYFITLFKDKIASYIARLTARQRPRMVIVCMIYYPDMHSRDGWADRALGFLGYNRNPEKLQLAVRTLYKHASCKISDTVPFPMYAVLDGSDSGNYVQRVEPSVMGGRKLAQAFAGVLQE